MIELNPQQRQEPQIGQEGNPISGIPTLVDADAIVGPSATEASQDTPIIDASHIGTRDLFEEGPEFDLPLDDLGDVFDSPPRLGGFRSRWLSRDRSTFDEASEVGAIDEAAGGTPKVDWELDSIPANPESPRVVVAERDAKVLANHTFLFEPCIVWT